MVADEVTHTERQSAERNAGWWLPIVVFGSALLLYAALGYAVYRIVTALL